ncbi:hypothetical protein AVEN_249728-1 [Araneus ventricosus]|uniref:Uncharacterized protein n=1 Tax=Araneus ventricosus TaxID=182803 RepID=A0A4Y2C664_ARAVE|nr:hypothetical protein AVEN_249728-1 [Araneus ventricosus]
MATLEDLTALIVVSVADIKSIPGIIERVRESCLRSCIVPAYLKRFHLSDSDFCSCGGIGTALHYATECICIVSWNMRKPAPNFEQEWLKRVANNLVSRHKIRGIIKFLSENRYLFRPP